MNYSFYISILNLMLKAGMFGTLLVILLTIIAFFKGKPNTTAGNILKKLALFFCLVLFISTAGSIALLFLMK